METPPTTNLTTTNLTTTNFTTSNYTTNKSPRSKEALTRNSSTKTTLAGLSVKSNNKLGAEKMAKLEVKISTASKDDKPKDFILLGNPPLQEMVASRTKEKEQPIKGSPTHKKFEDFTNGFGSKMLEKFGWVKGTAIGKTQGGIIAPLLQSRGLFDGKPVTILKQVQKPQDERKIQVINDLESLLADDYKENDNKEKTPYLPASLEWFHLGSFDAPLVRDLRGLSVREEPQQDPQATNGSSGLNPLVS